MPTDAAVVDLDDDGLSDALAIEAHFIGHLNGNGLLHVHRQTSPGVFDAQSIVVGCYPWRVVPADLDGDGRRDLVVLDAENCVDRPATRGLWWLRQDPQNPGRLLAPQQIAMADATAYHVAIADLNGDGALDLAVGDAATGADRLVVRYQDASQPGHFGAPLALPMPGEVGAVTAGDVDGDGRADLLVLVYGEPAGFTPRTTLAVVGQQGDGSLAIAAAGLAPALGYTVDDLAIRDANGDGRADLLVYRRPFEAPYRPMVSVLLQAAAAPAWGAPIDTPMDDVIGAMHFADVDADGRPDFAGAATFPIGSTPFAGPELASRLAIGLGRSDGTFAVRQYDLPMLADAAGIGDLDGDGRRDVLLYGGTGRPMMWMPRTAGGDFEAARALP